MERKACRSTQQSAVPLGPEDVKGLFLVVGILLLLSLITTFSKWLMEKRMKAYRVESRAVAPEM